MVRRWLPLLAMFFVLVQVVSACTGGPDLNPQPLPPGETGDDQTPGEPVDEPGVGSSSSGGTTGAAAPGADAGADAGDDA